MNPLPGTTPNGIRWAYALMEREANGEQLVQISAESWREVLGFQPDMDAKKAREAARQKEAA